jgi:hypothetical protein
VDIGAFSGCPPATQVTVEVVDQAGNTDVDNDFYINVN